MSFSKSFSNYLRAGYPGVVVTTGEEPRALAEIAAVVRATPSQGAERTLATWSATEGLRVVLPQVREVPDSTDLVAALAEAGKLERAVIVFRDVEGFGFEREPVLGRMLRDLVAGAPARGSCVVILGAGEFAGYPSLKPYLTRLAFDLPSRAELADVVARIGADCGLDDLGDGDVIRALAGCGVAEAENALALSFVESRSFDPAVLFREKLVAVKASGLLEVIPSEPLGVAAIGGLASLKAWIAERRGAYSDEARAYGLPMPKGCLLVGAPGTGKSLAAKCFGAALGLPILRLDPGSMMGSLVGQSEQRMRDALALARAMAPCVVWIDEIDKGLAGTGGSGSNDSGVGKRVLGTLLTSLQELGGQGVFFVATANDVSALPPELYRRGRWDEVWGVDLPSKIERAEIALVQIARHVKAAKAAKAIDAGAVAEVTEGFTGAEIEAAMVAALFRAYARDRSQVTTADVVAAAREIVPLATMAKAQVEAAREWARKNARSAGEVAPASVPAGRKIG